LDEAQSKAAIDRALELGVNFVDTANVYGQGHSEEFIASALGSRRDQMVIATKFNFMRPGPGTVAERIIAQAEESLTKLKTDHIDLYQLHMPAEEVPVDELLGTLDGLVKAGKVRAIGVCNYGGWRLAEAEASAEKNGTVRISTVQNYYHLLARQIEAEVVPYCAKQNMSILPYHPLAGGFLTGKYHQNEPMPEGTRGAAGSGIINAVTTPENYAKLAKLVEFCSDHGHTVTELAIAWLIANPTVGSVIAGVSTPAQVEANVASGLWTLTAEEKAEVDAIVNPTGVPSPERPPYSARG